MSKKVEMGNKIKVNYKGSLEDGTIFEDSSKTGQLLEVVVGSGQVLPKLEENFVGMEIGEKKQIKLSQDDAYGKYNPNLLKDISIEQFPPNVEPKVGMSVNVRTQNDQSIPAMITKVQQENVQLDLNHPLAGKALIFDVSVEEIK